MSVDRHTSDSFERKEYCLELLEKLYQSRKLTADVHLLPSNAINENDCLPANKLILATGCPYFQDLFYPVIKPEPEVAALMIPLVQQIPPTQSPLKVNIPIDKIILEIVLGYIYLDQYVITMDRWEGLMGASKLLKLDKLTQKCRNFLNDQGVTKETWAFHFRLAIDNNKNEVMLGRVFQFLKTISSKILDTPGFVNLKFREIKMLVDAGVWANPTDFQRAKYKWYGHENHLKIPHMDDLVKLDLPKVDSTSNPQDKSNEDLPIDLPVNNQPPNPANVQGLSQSPSKNIQPSFASNTPTIQDSDQDLQLFKIPKMPPPKSLTSPAIKKAKRASDACIASNIAEDGASNPLKKSSVTFGGSKSKGKRAGGPSQTPSRGQETSKEKRRKVEVPQKNSYELQKIQQTTPQTPETPGTLEESVQEGSQKTEEVDEKKQVVEEESKEESSLFRSEDEEVKEEELTKSTTIWGTIIAGESVFARWTDKIYYSGNIIEKMLNDSWMIAFDDNMDGVAYESHILPMKVLGVGIQCVYCPDVIYQSSVCTIIGQKYLQDGTVLYAIQCIDKPSPLFCTRRHLSIKEAEAKKIRKEFNASYSKPSDLSILNIIESKKRSRTATGPDPPLLTNSGKVDGRSRRDLGGAFDETATDEKYSKITPKAPKNVVPKRLRKSVDAEEGGKEPEESLETRTNVSLVEESKVESKAPAKESEKRSKSKEERLFHGMQFFLTATGGGDPSLIGASIGQKITSYDRDAFRKKLKSNGGKVIDTVGKESKSKEKYGAGIFLISDSPARTVKYIYCLAAGIPIISFNWVSDCISQNKLADWRDYQINAGWSLEKQMIIPIHKEKPLRGLKIFMFSNTEDLFYYWKPVLAAAEAVPLILKPKKKKKIPLETDVLVTDIVRSHPVLDYARENEIPVVRPEWLVQTIICGERFKYDGHDRYLVQIEDTGDEDAEGSAIDS